MKKQPTHEDIKISLSESGILFVEIFGKDGSVAARIGLPFDEAISMACGIIGKYAVWEAWKEMTEMQKAPESDLVN